MTISICVADFRRWASNCRAQADDAMTSGDERARLMLMADALNVLADQQDWLDGKTSQIWRHTGPVGASTSSGDISSLKGPQGCQDPS
jgi:hypothetical protein